VISEEISDEKSNAEDDVSKDMFWDCIFAVIVLAIGES
jgi:hypothetical protein